MWRLTAGSPNAFSFVSDAELGTITVTAAGAGQGTTTGQPGNVSNMVIGANKVLYITGDGGLYAVQLKVGPRLRPGTTGLR